ncbi:MAG TPA: protease inhibitor I42 family protein [Patescibacteria group bacterium]|nr:protease inhibitor I42 family protein [Patescibacteria group bacterium]
MAKTKKTNKTMWVVAAAVVVALAVGGALMYIHKHPSKITVTENQSNIEVKKGQQFTISLASNASTGYSWSVDDTYNKNVITKVSNKYQAANTNMSGAPGKELWVFKGANKGSTKLNFKYTRSWEANMSPASSKTFDVTVK